MNADDKEDQEGEAIDQALPVDLAQRAAAADTLLAAESMAIPEPAELRTELDELRRRRE